MYSRKSVELRIEGPGTPALTGYSWEEPSESVYY